jgi:hypothetical protein
LAVRALSLPYRGATELAALWRASTRKENEMTCETAATESELMLSAATGTLPRRELIRRGLRAGLGLAAVAALALTPRPDVVAAATSIPPNCIYVCCDGRCDSWKMCLKCVTWPKATTATTAVISR